MSDQLHAWAARLGAPLLLVAAQGCSGTIAGTEPVGTGGTGSTSQGGSGGAGQGAGGAGGTTPAAGGNAGSGIGASAGAGGSLATGGTAGAAGSGPGAGSAGMPSPEPPAQPTASATMIRLSHVQLENTLRALLQVDVGDVRAALTKDAVLRFDNQADALFVGESLRAELQSVAERLATEVTADPAALARLVPANAPNDVAGRARAFLEDFGRKAFRRPLTSQELDEYVALFGQAPTLVTGLGAFEAGARVTLEAFLQSPSFLYRSAFGGPAAPDGSARLTAHESASALSYALTNSTPDAELSAAADAGSLSTGAAVAAQATRLLETAGAAATVDHFNLQLFGLEAFDLIRKDPVLLPAYSDTTGALLREESMRFLGHVFGQGGGVRDIYTSPVTFVNASVAAIYGLSGSFAPSTWSQVALTPTERPGILTRLGFLAFYGRDALQDSIRRGVYVNGRVLCVEMTAPEDIAIPALPPRADAQTNRELVDSFTGPGTCGAGCHAAYINPAGFAFENFDGLGTYRTTEGGQPIDSSGTYPFEDGDATFANLKEFTDLLALRPDVHGCYTKQLLSSLYSRVPNPRDAQIARQLAQRSLAENLSSRALILALVENDAFLTRYPEVAP